MQSDVTNVETELREIEKAFATGRMNAFGSASTQDAFVHELKRIAEIETQVFYRTCALLKTSSINAHTLVTNMYASAQPPPQSQRSSSMPMATSTSLGDGSFHGTVSGLDNSAPRMSTNLRNPSPLSTVATGNRGSPGVPLSSPFPPGANRPPSRNDHDSGTTSGPFSGLGESGGGSGGAAPHIRPGEWGNENGFSDWAFEDVAAHFEELESQFNSLSDNFREISNHVFRLNDMSEQVNSGASYGANSSLLGFGVGNSANDIGGGSP